MLKVFKLDNKNSFKNLIKFLDKRKSIQKNQTAAHFKELISELKRD